MDNDSIIQQLAVLNEKFLSQEKDIKLLYKKYDELANANNSNYVAIQTILVKLDNMTNKIDDLAKTVSELSQKPAKNWDSMIKNAVSAVVGGLITFVLVKFGLSK
jgi:predicted  nucleic acid-binding Zn-ribbon protein